MVTVILVPWYFTVSSTDKCILTVRTTMDNKTEDVPVKICYINVLNMLSYHTDNGYLIWSSAFIILNLVLISFCIYSLTLKWHNYDHQWPSHIPWLGISCRDNKCNQQRSKANHQTSSWLLMWLLHLDWIPTQSERWFCPWHKHAIEVQERLLLQSSGLLYVFWINLKRLRSCFAVMENAWKCFIYFKH